MGDDGLIRSRQNKNYSFQFKLSVVELYLSSEVSYQELALSQGINNSALIARWVNDFRIAGPDALRPKKKGRKKTLGTDKKSNYAMSRKGNCYDNSVMENFFGILKQEMYYGTTYYSFDELKEAIERYIKYYNEKRIKEKLGWMSPVQYRLNALAA